MNTKVILVFVFAAVFASATAHFCESSSHSAEEAATSNSLSKESTSIEGSCAPSPTVDVALSSSEERYSASSEARSASSSRSSEANQGC